MRKLLILGIFSLFSFGFWQCGQTIVMAALYDTDTLEILPLSEHVFVHTSYLAIPDYGTFPCNGLIVVDQGEAIILDTPTTDSVAFELISWVRNSLKAEIVAVVPNHFHVDCLGGLNAFHEAGIPSYAQEQTSALAKADDEEVPQNSFSNTLTLKAGSYEVINQYLGPAHAPDNIVSFIPKEKILFGGCMVKSLGAGKGNLAHADTLQWPKTIGKIKATFPKARIIVPGHGPYGGTDLLDYTIEVFSN